MMMTNELKGSHNSATGHKISGWLRYFSPIVNLFSRCQDKTLHEQYDEGVRVFDLQVRYYKGKWVASHGPIKYDVEPLNELRRIVQENSSTVYVLLGLDRGWSNENDELNKFIQLWKNVEKEYPFELVKVYVDGKETLYKSEHFFDDVHERYWSMGYAKTKIDKWWKLWKYAYLLPLPKVWSKHFHDEWQKEFDCYQGYIKDFV